MNNDIKETITRMASYTIHYDCCSEGDAEEDIDKLLDYITNLQNTNKNHSKKLIELGDKITNLQEENEKLLKKSYSDDVRITKAIEYINKEKYVSADENCEIIAGYHIDELLNILTGGKEE